MFLRNFIFTLSKFTNLLVSSLNLFHFSQSSSLEKILILKIRSHNYLELTSELILQKFNSKISQRNRACFIPIFPRHHQNIQTRNRYMEILKYEF